MHRYRAAAKRAAWYDDTDDAPDYNPFRKSRRPAESATTYDNADNNPNYHVPFCIDHLNEQDDHHQADSIEVGNHSKNTAASAVLSPLVWRPKALLASRSTGQNGPKETIAESGLLLAAPMGVSRSHIKRPTKFSVVELCSKHDAANDTALPTIVVDKEHHLSGPSQKQNEQVDFLKNPLTDYLNSRTQGSRSIRDWRVLYIQDDTSAFKHLVGLYKIDFQRQKARFNEWSLGNIYPHSQRSSSVGIVDPLATGETIMWKPKFDQARNLTCTAFGLEYLTPWRSDFLDTTSAKNSKIQSILPRNEGSTHRLSVYLQLQKFDPSETEKPSKSQFTSDSTIIIFDSAPNSLASEGLPLGSEPWHEFVEDLNSVKANVADQPTALAVIKLLFERVAENWNDYIFSMHTRITSVEEKIYDNPADDTQSSLVWSISKEVLQAQRILKCHIQLLERIQDRLAFLITFDPQPSPDWLRQHIDEYQRLGGEIEGTLKQPIAHVIDLMYKSVSIRDARQSLDLNTSLWRLSWITFIFLPLTFLVGFFGMNVDTFKGEPSLKWYFIAAVPLMILVLLAWLATRQMTRKDLGILGRIRDKFPVGPLP